jgi:hypothetical protein
MSTEQLAQALLTGLGAAQELLEIKRKELGDDYSKTYGYWKAERELSAALAAHESFAKAHEAEKAQAVPNGRLFRKKPVVIEAFQMTVERRMDNSEWPDWLNNAWNKDEGQAGALFRQNTGATMPDMLCIQTLEGVHLVGWGDWIIRGVKGELYPCKPDIFAATYEPATAAPAAPASVSEAPVAVPLTDEDLRNALRQCPHDAVENLRVRWLYATDFAREIERECAARWGVKLEGGQE